MEARAEPLRRHEFYIYKRERERGEKVFRQPLERTRGCSFEVAPTDRRRMMENKWKFFQGIYIGPTVSLFPLYSARRGNLFPRESWRRIGEFRPVLETMQLETKLPLFSFFFLSSFFGDLFSEWDSLVRNLITTDSNNVKFRNIIRGGEFFFQTAILRILDDI